MYTTCLYCNNSLGANQVVESFPVGRRLAFDQRAGRLWVVCRKCEKWNLVPFEERWDAIEDCERRFHDARKRVSSDNIGLARLSEGLELVRIGEPMRPEFAAWRYGDQFGRRRRKAILIGTGVGIAGGGLLVAGAMAGVLTGGGYGLWQLAQFGFDTARRRRRIATVRGPSGEPLTILGRHAEKSHIIPARTEADVWGLRLYHGQIRSTDLYGDEARRAAALIMPRVNLGGASRSHVNDAVQRIETAGDPGRYLELLAAYGGKPGTQGRAGDPTEPVPGWLAPTWASGQPKSKRKGKGADAPMGLSKLDVQTRLAIEMAVNEENERAALQGELAALELEWKEAEELATIVDTLALPASVDEQFEELKRRNEAPRTGDPESE